MLLCLRALNWIAKLRCCLYLSFLIFRFWVRVSDIDGECSKDMIKEFYELE